MVKSRRKASSSEVPNVLSRRMNRRGADALRFRFPAGALARFFPRHPLGVGLRRHLLAEGRDLDGLVAELDMGQAESAADDPAVPEERLDLLRMCGGAEVEVLGPSLQQQVSHPPADEVGLEVVLLEPRDDLEGVAVDLPSGDDVFRPRDGRRRPHREVIIWHGSVWRVGRGGAAKRQRSRSVPFRGQGSAPWHGTDFRRVGRGGDAAAAAAGRRCRGRGSLRFRASETSNATARSRFRARGTSKATVRSR